MKTKIIFLIMLTSAIRVFAGQDYAAEWIAKYVTPGIPTEQKTNVLPFVRWFNTNIRGESSFWQGVGTIWHGYSASLDAASGGKATEREAFDHWLTMTPVLWGTQDPEMMQLSPEARRKAGLRLDYNVLNEKRPEGLKVAEKAKIEYWKKLKHATCKYLKGLHLSAEDLEEFEKACEGGA